MPSHESGTPAVVRRERGKRLPPNTVYVGRPSRWGNPFKIGRDGDRAEVIARYRAWLLAPEQACLRADARRELAGRDLACWCAPEPCHADILLKIANGSLDPVAYAHSPAGGSYRGKAGCRNLTCTQNGNPDRCYGWHCILCDGPSNCQGDCSNPNCPHPPTGSVAFREGRSDR